MVLRKQLSFDKGRLAIEILEFATDCEPETEQVAVMEVQMKLLVLSWELATET